ncbi:M56 family metallopeptidase [Hymenobacter sp. GOD-10R]|uniref:M56 family metallopeptidase n=1 Tax=Hymenobacter sp. GOD-10R TaxID=3093922 RepID=UPI002D78ECDD|nr:M56 family metallopeptidase [Hymenobacter sp. GOD-10R]WRQ26430.1 M56 family metallopeptidase [Hymenobacter sp. GOD-10R]
MPALLVYLLQVNGALLLFCAAYYLVLRRLTFYGLNRWFMLFAFGFATMYPFAEADALLRWFRQPIPAPLLPMAWSPLVLAGPAAQPFPYWHMLVLLYWTGTGLLLTRFLLQLASLYRVRLHSRLVRWQGLAFRQVAAPVNPFSFWQTIYLNPDQHTAAELPAILRHEQVHVQQWHTLDVLLAQLLQAFCWFNPAAWWLRRAVQDNLEFITDRAVLRTGLLDAKVYQYNLVKLSKLAPTAALANHFTFRTLKSRILMMNKQRSSSVTLFAYALLVPSLIVATISCSKPQIEPSTAAAQPTTVDISAEAKEKRDVKLPDNMIYFIDGRESDKSVLAAMDPATIESMSIFKGEQAQKLFSVKTAGVISIITKANKNSEAVQRFKQRYSLSATGQDPNSANIKVTTTGNQEKANFPANVLIVVNGQESTTQAAEALDVKSIDRMEVLKGQKAIDQYGEKGKNGVILVTTK